MGKGHVPIQMEMSIQVNGRMTKSMVKENILIEMVMNTKASSIWVLSRGKVPMCSRMAISILVSSRTVSEMDLEYLHMKMEINTLVSSKMVQWMVKVHLPIPMVIKE